MKCSVLDRGTAAAALEPSPLHLLREPAHQCPDHLTCRGEEREGEGQKEGEEGREMGGRQRGKERGREGGREGGRKMKRVSQIQAYY